jgi:hypothetical protein
LLIGVSCFIWLKLVIPSWVSSLADTRLSWRRPVSGTVLQPIESNAIDSVMRDEISRNDFMYGGNHIDPEAASTTFQS